MKYFTLLALAAVLATGCASNESSSRGGTSSGTMSQTGQGSQLSNRDLAFVQEAARSGQFEVQVGQMASQNANSQSAKQFAQHLLEDHTKANQELMQLASSKGVTPPTMLDEKHQRMIDQLTKLQGREFDEAFQKEAILAHEKDIALYEKAADKSTDPDLKAFAQKTLPTLRHHLQMAKTVDTTGQVTTESGGISTQP